MFSDLGIRAHVVWGFGRLKTLPSQGQDRSAPIRFGGLPAPFLRLLSFNEAGSQN